jgi:hypothetical protein
MTTAKRGYRETYKWVQSLLAKCDLEAAMGRLGMEKIVQTDGSIAVRLPFAGRIYTITRQDVTQTGSYFDWTYHAFRKAEDTGTLEEEFEYNLKSALGYYAVSDCALDAAGQFCQVSSFSHGVFRHEFFGRSIAPAYGNDHHKFASLMEKLGMEALESNKDSVYMWNYKMLPKMPVRVIWYEGDEEFPTDVQALVDKTAVYFFSFETLCVLHGCFNTALASIGRTYC